MQSSITDLLERRGYARNPDGSFSRTDSHGYSRTSTPEPPKPAKRKKRTAPVENQLVGPEHLRRDGISALAAKFEVYWNAQNGPELEAEFRFHPIRQWRFDYVHHASKTAVEIDGGIFNKGRHTRAKGYQGDCDKLNAAALFGYHVFRLTTGQVSAERVLQIIQHTQKAPP